MDSDDSGARAHAEMARRFGVRRSGLGVTAYISMLRHDPCTYCGAPYQHRHSWREVDHIHARARGGANRWWNYTAACGFCNVLKYDESPLEWLLKLRGLEQDNAIEFGHAEIPW